MHDPWQGVSNATEFLVNVFERNPEKGLPYSLDLLLFKPQVEVRRFLVWGPNDVQMPVPAALPYVSVLERGKQQPVLAESITDSTLEKIHALLEPMMEQLNQTEQAEAHARKPIQVVDCGSHPEQ